MSRVIDTLSEDFIEGYRLGYLAAITDGEGAITITRSIKRRKRGTILRHRKYFGDHETVNYMAGIAISNDSVELLESTKSMIGEGKINPIQDKRCNTYGLYIRKIEVVLRVLLDIQPYLLSDRKRRLCELVIEFCRSRLSKLEVDCGATYDEREVKIFWEVRELNSDSQGGKGIKWCE